MTQKEVKYAFPERMQDYRVHCVPDSMSFGTVRSGLTHGRSTLSSTPMSIMVTYFAEATVGKAFVASPAGNDAEKMIESIYDTLGAQQNHSPGVEFVGTPRAMKKLGACSLLLSKHRKISFSIRGIDTKRLGNSTARACGSSSTYSIQQDMDGHDVRQPLAVVDDCRA